MQEAMNKIAAWAQAGEPLALIVTASLVAVCFVAFNAVRILLSSTAAQDMPARPARLPDDQPAHLEQLDRRQRFERLVHVAVPRRRLGPGAQSRQCGDVRRHSRRGCCQAAPTRCSTAEQIWVGAVALKCCCIYGALGHPCQRPRTARVAKSGSAVLLKLDERDPHRHRTHRGVCRGSGTGRARPEASTCTARAM